MSNLQVTVMTLLNMSGTLGMALLLGINICPVLLIRILAQVIIL